MGYYIVVPYEVYSKYASPSNLYGLLLVLSKKDGYCYASNRYLADALETSARTIQNHLKQLQDDKLVKVELEDNNKRRITTLDTFRATKRPKPKGKSGLRRSDFEPEWLDGYLDYIAQMDV